MSHEAEICHLEERVRQLEKRVELLTKALRQAMVPGIMYRHILVANILDGDEP